MQTIKTSSISNDPKRQLKCLNEFKSAWEKFQTDYLGKEQTPDDYIDDPNWKKIKEGLSGIEYHIKKEL